MPRRKAVKVKRRKGARVWMFPRRWRRRAGPHGRCRWGPSEARCAPLARLLLLSDPGSWCSGTERGLRQPPGLCSAHGGFAGPEQRGVEQRESPRGRCRSGLSEARCVPLVRLLLLSHPSSWCSDTRKHLGQLPGLCSARGVVAGHEQRGVEQRWTPRGQLKRGKWALK